MKKISIFVCLLILTSCNYVSFKTAPKGPELIMGLKGEVVNLSAEAPFGQAINDRVSTVADTEKFVTSLLDASGALYMMSEIKHSDSGSNYVRYAYISRFLEDGTRDNGFGNAGITKIHSSYGDREHYTDMRLKDNKFTVIGNIWDKTARQAYDIASLKIDAQTGVIDQTYAPAKNGFFIKGITNRTYASKIIHLKDGTNLHLVGVNQNNPQKIYYYKTDSTGQLITSFGTSGLLDLGITSAAYNTYWRMVEDSQGNILTGYLEYVSGNYHITIMKMDSNGVVDASFGTNGYLRINKGTSSYFGDFKLLDDSTLSFIAHYNSGSWQNMIYNIDAKIGVVKAENGEVEITLPDGEICSTGGRAFYKKKVLIHCWISASSKRVIAAYNEDMSLDESFGEGGILDISGGDFTVSDLHIDELRKTLWVTGSSLLSGDNRKYFMKIKLSEVMVPKKTPIPDALD